MGKQTGEGINGDVLIVAHGRTLNIFSSGPLRLPRKLLCSRKPPGRTPTGMNID